MDRETYRVELDRFGSISLSRMPVGVSGEVIGLVDFVEVPAEDWPAIQKQYATGRLDFATVKSAYAITEDQVSE